jgi:hypothetical protein
MVAAKVRIDKPLKARTAAIGQELPLGCDTSRGC